MAVTAALAGCGGSSSNDGASVLAATPPMGFNDWNSFACDVDEDLIVATADLFVAKGLKDAGYQYINIDDCWSTANSTDAQAGRDATTGQLVPDPEKFPHGMKWLADYVHSKGLKLGIYSSAGYNTCQRVYAGSLGHEELDAQTFADWGIDYVKYDNCGEVTGGTSDNSAGWASQDAYKARYQAMADAIQKTGREMVYSVCEWGNYAPWTWVPALPGQLWRTTMDISDTYASMLSLFKQNVILADYAAPGQWNDPDMLEVGNGGMSADEYRSHFTLWAMMSAPLIIGTDLRVASADTLAILLNKDVIAVDQDRLGKQATLVSGDADGLYVLSKPLADGDVAVALFNSTATARTVSTTAAAVGLSAATDYRLTDLWTKAVTETTGSIAAYVPAHATTVYRVRAASSTYAAAPAVTLALSASAAQVAPGGSVTVKVSLVNGGSRAISGATLTVTRPSSAWTVTRASALATDVAAGATASVDLTVTAPASAPAPISTDDLTARVSYASELGTGAATSALTLTLVAPVSSPYLSHDASGEGSAVFAQSGDLLEIQAAGAGVSPASVSPFGSTAASDQYAAIYLDGAFGDGATLEATVTDYVATSGGFGSSAGQVGLIVRNDMTGGDTLPGVVLYVTTTGRVGMAWNAGGGSVVDASAGGGGGPPGSGGTTVGAPVVLRLVRTGTSVVGSYSTDGGGTWTAVGTATLDATAAGASQDAGVYFASGSAGAPSQAGFSGLHVTK